MRNGLLVKYGEIAIRGKNRYIFEDKLIEAIENNIKDNSNYYVKKEQGRFLIANDVDDFDYDFIIPKVKIIMGIVAVCPCAILSNNDINSIKESSLEYIKNNYNKDKNYKFKVECKRSDKNYPLNSMEISSLVGEYLLENTQNLDVDIHNPDIKLFIELRTNTYIYSKIIKGFGGLPIGSSGKAMLLLSGGIDSPVAGFLMEKRGVEIEAVYFHSPPHTSERAKEKVIDLAKRLADFSGGVKLHIVPFTDLQVKLYERVPTEKLTIFLKRAMIKIADKLAKQNNCQAIVLGDSIGQVASQTMRSINAIDSASTSPIIRPLACFDKQEIIDLGRKIGTFDISIRPFEDCCTVFVAKHPETKPKRNIIETMESRIEWLDSMIDEAISNIESIEL